MELLSVKRSSLVKLKNLHFIMKISSNEKKIKKQCGVCSVDKKMPILAEVDADMGTQVDIAAVLGFSGLMLNMMVSKQSKIEKSYSHCGPSFSKEHKPLKTSPLEELETILSAWFKQACTAITSIDGPHLKKKALHVVAHLVIGSFRA